jgi:L-fuconolactonase
MAAVIDTHLHFWDMKTYHRTEWMEGMPAIQKTFLPPDLKPHFDSCGVDYGVIVEAARDSHEMNLWWLSLAEQYDYIGAVIAGCQLEQNDLTAWFDEYGQSAYFVGVRTVPVSPPAEWTTDPGAQHGFQLLNERGLIWDVLTGHQNFGGVAAIAGQYPELQIILDHCARPPLDEGKLDEWSAALAPLAGYPNIHIKYSALLYFSSVDTHVERLRPVTDFLFEHFGVGRMMWGSNWPVELLGGDYASSVARGKACAAELSATERAALFGGNALTFFKVRTRGNETS